jgi:cysteine desulfurase
MASASPPRTAYLDHAASSPVRPAVVAAVAEALEAVPGNPSGSHRWAREARRRLDDAREVVADLVGAEPHEVVFTSGGTEADNLAVRGVVAALGRPAACSAVEHPAVRETVLATGGTLLAVDGRGRIDLASLEVPGPEPSVVSVMLVNNETGVVHDLAAIAEEVTGRWPRAVLHTDAVAAAAWFDLAERAAPASLVSLSAHKLGGPKGVGALVVRDRTPLVAVTTGGGQERGRRSGTPDVAGAVGFAAAFAAAAAERAATVRRVAGQRERLLAGLRATVAGLVETVPDGASGERSPATVHVCVPGVDRQSLLFLLDEEGVAASWGSSCASGAPEPSHVLTAMGVDPAWAEGSLRLSLGWSTTDDEIDHALAVLPEVVARLRGGGSGDPVPGAPRRESHPLLSVAGGDAP